METNQIRYFLALCEEQNFTRAAKRCWVSQPSVSNAIKRLEEELGGDLFHPTKNGVKLSPLGMAIRPYLERINDCAEGVTREAAYTSTANLLSIPARTKFMRKIFTLNNPSLCLFYRSTHWSPALLRDVIAFFGEHNCGRSCSGSDNRYKTSAATGCVVAGLSIRACELAKSMSAFGP